MGSLKRRVAGWRRAFAASPRARILFWATLIALLCGVLEAGEPVDRILHNSRDRVRSQPADSSIVLVEVNSATQRRVDALGMHRAVDAKAVDNLFRLGAKRVFIDKVYTDASAVGDDGAFAAALARHRGRVYLASRFETNLRTGKFDPLFPTPELRRVAQIGSIAAWRDSFGLTSRIPFMSQIGDKVVPSFASILADKYFDSLDTFAPDFSIEISTVPTINLLDALDATPAAKFVKGKDVIIGTTADSLGDTHAFPRYGPAPGVFVHIIAAQTLKRSRPINVGWEPFCLVAVIGAFAYVTQRRRSVRLGLLFATYALLLGAGLILDQLNIETRIAPALLLMTVVVVRMHILHRRARNLITGLPTLESILRDAGTSPLTLVGVKIGNHADLRATLSDDEQALLSAEIIRRVRVGGEPIDLMHAGDSFVWKTPLPVGALLFDHVEGLYALLTSPVSVGGRIVDLKVGIGIENGCDRPLTNRVGSLQVSADEALAAGAKWRVFDARHLEDASFRQSLLSRLDLALANGEIWVAYQPKLDLKQKRVCGAEALVRWSHPDRGLISPDQFIPMAEQANRIAGLTLFVLETAIRDAKAMDAIDADFGVAVNLSVRMLAQPDLPAEVAALLAKHQLAPHRLTLEITESEELDPNGDLKTLYGLRELGVQLSIDDYGTKFSTLDYIRQLPADEIKIDQRFVGNIHADRNAWIMASSTVELAHSLGLKVVAEGVELPEAVSALIEMGCDVAQGYLIGRPIRWDELKRFLSATRLRRVA